MQNPTFGLRLSKQLGWQMLVVPKHSISVPCAQNESSVLNRAISDYVYGAVELQETPSVEIVPAPGGLLQDFGVLGNPTFL